MNNNKWIYIQKDRLREYLTRLRTKNNRTRKTESIFRFFYANLFRSFNIMRWRNFLEDRIFNDTYCTSVITTYKKSYLMSWHRILFSIPDRGVRRRHRSTGLNHNRDGVYRGFI